jgi:hypothetical protein
MAAMQGILTHDCFHFIDIKLQCRWFGRESWTNKYTWTIFGKHWFGIWPLIVFTDAFHLAHFLFTLSLSLATTIHDYSWSSFLLAGFIYSSIFEIFYTYIFKAKE